MRTLAVVMLALAVGACASGPIGKYQPSLDNLIVLRGEQFGNIRVGEVGRAPGLAAAADRSVSVRGHTLSSPEGNSFAQYLRAAISTEFKAAAKLDPDSPVVVSGELSRNELHGAGTSVAKAALGARINVTRSGVVAYDRPIVVETEWPSAFMGAIAVPDAINHYAELYRLFVSRLLADPDFAAATRRE